MFVSTSPIWFVGHEARVVQVLDLAVVGGAIAGSTYFAPKSAS